MLIADIVACVHARHGFEIGEAIKRRGIRKEYYSERVATFYRAIWMYSASGAISA